MESHTTPLPYSPASHSTPCIRDVTCVQECVELIIKPPPPPLDEMRTLTDDGDEKSRYEIQENVNSQTKGIAYAQ